MSPSNNNVRRPVRGGRSAGGDMAFRQIIAGVAAVLALLLVGVRASAAFDSPLLATVAAGMLFLIGVALHGAIGSGRR